MEIYRGAAFTADRPWSGPQVARIEDAVVKLRWIDRPYEWHANTGDEVFVVLDGIVDMQVRANSATEARVVRMSAGDILFIGEGEEHVACPIGEARVLVIEEPAG